MAASLLLSRATSKALKCFLKTCAPKFTNCDKRYLLSQAYSCTEAWKKRMEDPVFSQIPLSEFAIELRDQYEKQKVISAVDMEILANKLHEMDIDEAEFMEDLMKKFRKSPDANPVKDAIIYPFVRNYIDNNMADRLVPLMQSRSETGIFPDGVTFSLLLDHFIEEEDFSSAAQVGYELMLQEDFSHPTSRLLALYATVCHLESVSLDDITPEEIKDFPEDEADWIPVRYIRYPTYDDHFDIKSQQYLLGKTLHVLGRELGQGTLRNSLQAAGLALHHKFIPCLKVLSEIAQSGDGLVVEDCLALVEGALEKVQVRDPDKPQKESGLLTIDDEIYKLLPTQEEKEAYRGQLQQVRQTLQDKGKVVEDKMSRLAEDMVKSQLPQCEAADIQVQTQQLQSWQAERQQLLKDQLYQLEKKRKTQEIENTLKELQEKEEMIRFFELHDKIRLIKPKQLPKEPSVEEEDEETLRAKRIKRRKFRHNV